MAVSDTLKTREMDTQDRFGINTMTYRNDIIYRLLIIIVDLLHFRPIMAADHVLGRVCVVRLCLCVFVNKISQKLIRVSLRNFPYTLP